jgi:uncharacterized membrane protein YfhO
VGADPRVYILPVYTYIIDSIKHLKLDFWTFEYGIGTSIFSMIWYITDPLNILLLLFTKRYIIIGLLVISLLKLLLTGTFFFKYLKYFKFSKFVIILTSVLYTFSSYVILWGQHFHFGTIVLIFTFILYALERYLRKGKAMLLYLSMVLLFTNNIYFAYMISIFLLIYIFFRLVWDDISGKKKIWFNISKIYILSFLFAAPAAFPTIYLLLSSSRVKVNLLKWSLFGGIHEFMTTIVKFFSTSLFEVEKYSGWRNIYESANVSSSLIVLIILPQLFFVFKSKRERKLLKIIIFLIFIMFFCPLFSFFMNKFSSYTYRWTFLLIPVILLGFATALDFIIKNKKISIKILYSSLIVEILLLGIGVSYFGMENLNKHNLIFTVLFLFIYTLIMGSVNKYKKNYYKLAVLLFCCSEIAIFSHVMISGRNTLTKNILYEKIDYFDETNYVISYINSIDTGFYRVEKNYFSVFANDSLAQNYRGLKSYDSLNSDYYLEFIESLDGEILLKGNVILGFDHDPVIQEILGVKYSLMKGKESFFDYEFLGKFGDVNLFRNNHDLSLGFIYNDYITRDYYNTLDQEKKRNSLLKYIILEKTDEKKDIAVRNNTKYPIKSEITDIFGIEEYKDINNEYKYITKNTTPMLYLGNFSKSDYLNFNFTIVSDYDMNLSIYVKTEGTELNEIDKRVFKLVKGKNEIKFDLEYRNIEYIRIGLGEKKDKTFIFQKIEVYENNFRDYLADIDKLKKQSIKISEFKNTEISGIVDAEEDGYLFLSIPYRMGWKIKIDGEDAKYEKVNIGFIGLPVKKGNHQIELKYEAPFFKVGILVFILTVFSTGVFNIVSKKKKAKKYYD